MDENEIAREIVDAAYHIHRKLGPGLLESVYETVPAFEAGKRGLAVRRQVPVSIIYEGIRFDEGFRADLIVEDKVIVGARLGLLINFGSALIRDGINRIVNHLPE